MGECVAGTLEAPRSIFFIGRREAMGGQDGDVLCGSTFADVLAEKQSLIVKT